MHPDAVAYVGAGISVAAGIPDFRSKQVIPGIPELAQRKLKDMFQLSMIMDETLRPSFARFSASLAQKTEDSQPTLFHKLLKALEDRGTLVRIYTQNIDGLESKAGVSTYHRSCPQTGDGLQRSTCIPLHGSLRYIYCQSCHAVEEMKHHQDELMHGTFPSCRSCQREQHARREAGKRVRLVPTMVPDVVLYGQEHPDSQGITEFQMQDLSGTQPIDLLLVVGTGMHVIGTQRIIREFSKQVRKNRSPTDPSPCVVYLNLECKQQKKWESIFDVWIQADCQTVAAAILDTLKEKGEKEKRKLHVSDTYEVDCLSVQHEQEPEYLTARRGLRTGSRSGFSYGYGPGVKPYMRQPCGVRQSSAQFPHEIYL
ncbi:DHS-like NAD/FAD-binding domain-containing protein [Boletus edulis]|nr:DHS-like NAD/FAD-binding domain-containing protein [Boletus edulis]